MVEVESLAIEAATTAITELFEFSDQTGAGLNPEFVASVAVDAARPLLSIQAESLATTARRLIDLIVQSGPGWRAATAKSEIRDVLIALQAYESIKATV